jgi:hypothetical protein
MYLVHVSGDVFDPLLKHVGANSCHRGRVRASAGSGTGDDPKASTARGKDALQKGMLTCSPLSLPALLSASIIQDLRTVEMTSGQAADKASA